jgi:cytoskeletal protein RodZ
MVKFLQKLNNPLALIVVMVLFVGLGSFLFYDYLQQLLPSIGVTQPDSETYPAVEEGYSDPSPAREATTETEEVAASGEAATTEWDASSGEAAAPEEGTVPLQEEAGALLTGVSVAEAPTWLSVWVDGESVLEGVSEPGFSQQFEADREVTISTGDAGAVSVEVNGYDLGLLGASGEAVTRTFTVGSET